MNQSKPPSLPASCLSTAPPGTVVAPKPAQTAAVKPAPATAIPTPKPKKMNPTAQNILKNAMSNPVIHDLIIAQHAGAIPFTDEKGSIIHSSLGNHLLKAKNVCKINGALHLYDNGIYKQDDDALHGHMIKLVPSITDAKRREVCRYLKTNLETPVKEVSPPHLIPFKSRIYNLDTDQFLDYTPEHVFLSRLPYDFIPDAPEQDIVTDTIAQIADGDSAVIRLIYEAIGNCFYFRNAYRGAIMLYGESGNNGKSTLLNMIRQLLGKENTSSLSLHDLTERFRLVGVYGKVANIGDDISGRYLPDAENFKKLVTGEYVTAEHKGQDAFDFVSFAKMFFAMNTLPPVSDKSRAFFSRLQLIPLNHDFSGAPDIGLKNREWSQAEMEYLTALAMQGLHRLRWQGGFTKPQACVELTAQYERDNNPIIEFLEDQAPVEGRPIAEVYASFQAWSQQAGHKNTFTRTRFTREIIRCTGLKSEPYRHSKYPGKIVRCFVSSVTRNKEV